MKPNVIKSQESDVEWSDNSNNSKNDGNLLHELTSDLSLSEYEIQSEERSENSQSLIIEDQSQNSNSNSNSHSNSNPNSNSKPKTKAKIKEKTKAKTKTNSNSKSKTKSKSKTNPDPNSCLDLDFDSSSCSHIDLEWLMESSDENKKNNGLDNLSKINEKIRRNEIKRSRRNSDSTFLMESMFPKELIPVYPYDSSSDDQFEQYYQIAKKKSNKNKNLKTKLTQLQIIPSKVIDSNNSYKTEEFSKNEKI
ncbi:cerebellar degeneration-related antigen 1 [Anaeramoeba flamelloides]|uniref:Cerebellar degeneration-related antigen 1 n=1 Tax=Anaeramoeba flamelloides TaxID=1746091 RepID=A0ABQ8YIT2_9EUKA|nr:cerebellar degeneration-related antigen 1 [Anaeramoeba flamelloides]